MVSGITDLLSAVQNTNVVLSKLQQTLSSGLPVISVPVSVANGGTGSAVAGNVALQNIGAAPFLRGYLGGLQISSTTNTTIPTTAGVATDDTNTALLSIGSTTLNLATNGVNGLDTGALANNTWYHAFIISQAVGATPALLASTSVSAPSFPATYTLKRRIFSFKTDGAAHVINVVQDGDYFQWATLPALSVNTVNPGAAAVTATLEVPTGVNVLSQTLWGVQNAAAAGNASLLVTDLAVADAAPSATQSQVTNVETAAGFTSQQSQEITARTNTSGQVRYRLQFSDANVSVTARVRGWFDSRGRFV